MRFVGDHTSVWQCVVLLLREQWCALSFPFRSGGVGFELRSPACVCWNRDRWIMCSCASFGSTSPH